MRPQCSLTYKDISARLIAQVLFRMNGKVYDSIWHQGDQISSLEKDLKKTKDALKKAIGIINDLQSNQGVPHGHGAMSKMPSLTSTPVPSSMPRPPYPFPSDKTMVSSTLTYANKTIVPQPAELDLDAEFDRILAKSKMASESISQPLQQVAPPAQLQQQMNPQGIYTQTPAQAAMVAGQTVYQTGQGTLNPQYQGIMHSTTTGVPPLMMNAQGQTFSMVGGQQPQGPIAGQGMGRVADVQAALTKFRTSNQATGQPMM